MSDTDMTTVADAIRTKTGGSDPLAFPTGFSEAIEGITTGGGSGESAYEALGRALTDSFATVSGGEYTLKVADFVDALPKINLSFPDNHVMWDHIFTKRSITSIDWTGVSELVIAEHAFSYVVFRGSNPSIPAGFRLGTYIFERAQELGGYPLDASYTSVPDNLCSYCTFTEDVVVPEGVTLINAGAFGNVSRNTSVELTVTLPSTLTTISGYASVSATSGNTLKLVVNAVVPPTLNSSGGIRNLSSITVPAGTLSAYQAATNWAQFADIMTEASA